MLVLTRKKGESIMIGDQIELVVLGTEGDSVRLGITAPKSIEVFRKEIYISIQQANQEAAKSTINLHDLNQYYRKSEKIEDK
jgi:carbon storage regulator